MLTGPIGKFVRKDYLSLIVWQLANYAMPLALITYFSRVLGVKGFGIYGIALGVLNACMVITDWGFLYTSQRALVEASGDIGREQEIIWETGTAKFLLAILCSMALCIGANGVGFHSPYALPLLAGIPALFASAVSQEWILRGKEKFLAFALSSVVGRAVSIPFAFLVVKTADDAVWAIASVSVGQLGASLLSVMLSDTRKYTVPRISILHALTRIKDGLPLFIPIAAVNLFSVMLPPLIGLTSGPVEAGIYSGADRIRGAARMLFYPLTVVAYPKINALRIKDPIALKSYLSKLIAIVFFGSAVVCGLIMLLAKSFIYVLLGHKVQDAIVVLRC